MSDGRSSVRTFHIAMIGDSSTVRGFAAGGVHAYPAAASDEARAMFARHGLNGPIWELPAAGSRF